MCQERGALLRYIRYRCVKRNKVENGEKREGKGWKEGEGRKEGKDKSEEKRGVKV